MSQQQHQIGRTKVVSSSIGSSKPIQSTYESRSLNILEHISKLEKQITDLIAAAKPLRIKNRQLQELNEHLNRQLSKKSEQNKELSRLLEEKLGYGTSNKTDSTQGFLASLENQIQNLKSKGVTLSQLQSTVEGWILGLPTGSSLQRKLQNGIKRIKEDESYLNMVQKMKYAQTLFQNEMADFSAKNPGVVFGAKSKILDILAAPNTKVGNVNLNGIVQIQQQLTDINHQTQQNIVQLIRDEDNLFSMPQVVEQLVPEQYIVELPNQIVEVEQQVMVEEIVPYYKDFSQFPLTEFFSQNQKVPVEIDNNTDKEGIKIQKYQDLIALLSPDVNLYENPQKFNKAIREFIESQNCSRIQLQTFIKEVIAKGEEFQKNNQTLIELLIEGFCTKLEIREDAETKKFIELIEDIQITRSLGIKLDKIIKINSCLGVLDVFNCERLTYSEMLKFQTDYMIFKILLEKYFNQEIKRDSVRIEDQQITLEYVRNMLTVLFYIWGTIQFDISQKQLLLIYGVILIEWKQFDVIKSIIYDQPVLQQFMINRQDFTIELARNCLQTIYTNENIGFDEEVKGQIYQILNILPEDVNIPLRNQELAKLKLVDIFESWEVVVHPIDISSVCIDWSGTQSRKAFILNLFEVYIDKLTITNFKTVYTYLEQTLDRTYEGESTKQIQLNNDQFVKFILIFAQKLLEKNRYAEIIEIFAFVKQIKDQKIDYKLVTEAFLMQICALYPQSTSVQAQEPKEEGEKKAINPLRFPGKEIIEYFFLKFKDGSALQDMFSKGLVDVHFGQFDREKQIKVEGAYCFRKSMFHYPEKVYVSLDLLWKIVCDQIKQREQSNKLVRSKAEEIYYAYYFLLAVFKKPRSGLGSLKKISYSLQVLTNLLFRLESVIDEHPQLWGINTYNMFIQYFRGLVQIVIPRVEQDQNISDDLVFQHYNIGAIKPYLKRDTVRNKQLYDSIIRVDAYIKPIKMTQKELRYKSYKEELDEAKSKQVEVQPEVKVNVQSNTTITLKMMRERKQQQNQMSKTMDILKKQKQQIEHIYKRVGEEKKEEETINKNRGD